MLSCLLGQLSPGQLSPGTVVTWALAYFYNFGHSEQLLLKTLFYLKSRCMRYSQKKTERFLPTPGCSCNFKRPGEEWLMSKPIPLFYSIG